jgi:IS5 family transposase
LFIQSSNPTIRISGKNLAKFIAADIPLAGKGATHANTSIVLRKRLQTAAGFVANATAEHVLITAAGMAAWEQVHSATGNGRVEDVLLLTCRHDGTNTPIVVDTTYAIP